jgi:hypothetical protein
MKLGYFERLLVFYLVMKYPSFYGTGRLITVLTINRPEPDELIQHLYML